MQKVFDKPAYRDRCEHPSGQEPNPASPLIKPRLGLPNELDLGVNLRTNWLDNPCLTRISTLHRILGIQGWLQQCGWLVERNITHLQGIIGRDA